MGCAYHREYNAAKLAIMVAAPIVIGFATAQFSPGQVRVDARTPKSSGKES
jgi:hypothetical protein